MIECVFTIDYEIYGNGDGSLKELVYAPAEQLKAIFVKSNARFVAFIEVAELEMIEANNTDQALDLVKHQIRDLYSKGFELGLHLHPQWYNARYRNGKWQLDYGEYNLCTLHQDRIKKFVARSIGYMQELLNLEDFTPFSFRAGNWLFQPSCTLAKVLVDQGVKVDSSVFKGGVQHQYRLDYRRAQKNGYFWSFLDDVNVPNLQGTLIEFPIYTKMVPIWKFFTNKRVGLLRKVPGRIKTGKERLSRILDFLRFYQPIKFDFCRVNLRELIHLLDKEIQLDQKDPTLFRPIIAIGHTKDLIDFKTVDSLLSYLRKKEIPISTFRSIYYKHSFSNNGTKS